MGAGVGDGRRGAGAARVSVGGQHHKLAPCGNGVHGGWPRGGGERRYPGVPAVLRGSEPTRGADGGRPRCASGAGAQLPGACAKRECGDGGQRVGGGNRSGAAGASSAGGRIAQRGVPGGGAQRGRRGETARDGGGRRFERRDRETGARASGRTGEPALGERPRQRTHELETHHPCGGAGGRNQGRVAHLPEPAGDAAWRNRRHAGAAVWVRGANYVGGNEQPGGAALRAEGGRAQPGLREAGAEEPGADAAEGSATGAMGRRTWR